MLCPFLSYPHGRSTRLEYVLLLPKRSEHRERLVGCIVEHRSERVKLGVRGSAIFNFIHV
jgi:hypothetical protein